MEATGPELDPGIRDILISYTSQVEHLLFFLVELIQ